MDANEEFRVPLRSREAAQFAINVISDQAIAQAYILQASGMTERQAVSFVANVLTRTAWNLASAERLAAGEQPNPERFLDMARSHTEGDDSDEISDS